MVAFYNTYGQFHARRGQWRQALTNWELVVQCAPDDHVGYQFLAPLLLQLNDVDGYKLCRAQILREFEKTTDPVIAERMVITSLILPATGDEMKIISKMADVALGGDTNSDRYGFDLLAKGFAEYRLGHYKRSVELVRKAEPMDLGSTCRTEAYFILAMARFKLNRLDDCRESYTNAMNSVKTKLAHEGDLDEGWNHWITAHMLMREATGVMGADAFETGTSVPKSGTSQR